MKNKRFLSLVLLLTGYFTPAILKACYFPSGIIAYAVTTSSVTISCNAVSGATSYKTQYRIKGTIAWTVVSATSNSKMLTGLETGTMYEIQVRTICSSQKSAFSSSQTFETRLPTPNHI